MLIMHRSTDNFKEMPMQSDINNKHCEKCTKPSKIGNQFTSVSSADWKVSGYLGASGRLAGRILAMQSIRPPAPHDKLSR